MAKIINSLEATIRIIKDSITVLAAQTDEFVNNGKLEEGNVCYGASTHLQNAIEEIKLAKQKVEGL